MLHKIEINILKSNLGNSLKMCKAGALRISYKWYWESKTCPQNQIKFKSIYKVLIMHPVPCVAGCELGKECNAYICKRNSKKYNIHSYPLGINIVAWYTELEHKNCKTWQHI